MLPENRAFFIRGDDGEEYGPVDMTELREWVRENRAGLGTEVRTDEEGSLWRAWQYFPELVALLAEARSTTAVPGLAGLVLAPISRRVVAFGLDLILGTILVMPIIGVLGLIYAPEWYIQIWQAVIRHESAAPQAPLDFEVMSNAISNLVLVLYLAGFHARHGQTPAKALLRICVVDQNGQKPAVLKSLLRALGLVVSIFPVIGFCSLLYAYFNPQRRAFHDVIAGTYVVEA